MKIPDSNSDNGDYESRRPAKKNIRRYLRRDERCPVLGPFSSTLMILSWQLANTMSGLVLALSPSRNSARWDVLTRTG